MDLSQINKLLSKCSPEQTAKLFHGIIDKICGRDPPRYQEFSEVYRLEEWWEITEKCMDVCKDCGKNNYTSPETFNILGELPVGHKQSIADVISSRRADLRKALIKATCAISNAQLNDFDWQMKLVLSSDKMSGIMEPLVSLDLDVQNCDSSKITSIELNKQDLQTMLNSLEAANRAVMQLKAT